MSMTASLSLVADTGRRRAEAEARRADRMAELVAELTGCPATGARHAVREVGDAVPVGRDALATVARAMVALGRPSPLRSPAYL